MADFQQQRDGKLADRIRSVCWDISHHDTGLFTCLCIHNIKSGGQHADIFQIPARGNCFPGDRRLVHDDYLGIPNPLRNFIFRSPVVYRHIPQRLKTFPAQIARVFRISVQYNNFQHYYLLFFPLVYEPNRYCSHGYVPRGVFVRFLQFLCIAKRVIVCSMPLYGMV